MKQIDVQEDFKDLPKVRVFKTDFVRALSNLIHNAIKYSETRSINNDNEIPKILIKYLVENKYMVIKIENWGIGISSHELEKGLIFHFGSRGEYSQKDSKTGTGIGLTDAMEVARNHWGTIEIESHDVTKTSEKHITKAERLHHTIVKFIFKDVN